MPKTCGKTSNLLGKEKNVKAEREKTDTTQKEGNLKYPRKALFDDFLPTVLLLSKQASVKDVRETKVIRSHYRECRSLKICNGRTSRSAKI